MVIFIDIVDFSRISYHYFFIFEMLEKKIIHFSLDIVYLEARM